MSAHMAGSATPAIPPTPVVTEADRAWAREQIEKGGPMPQDLVDYINGLRRDAAAKLAATAGSHISPVPDVPPHVVQGRGSAGGEQASPRAGHLRRATPSSSLPSAVSS